MIEPTEAQKVCYEAYAALGTILMDLAEKGHPQAEKLLDNLSEARLMHSDVLPFTDVAAAPVPSSKVLDLVEKLDGYLTSPEQIALRDALLAALIPDGVPGTQAPHIEEALRQCAQALAWLAFGECRGWHDTLPTAHEALKAAKSALGVAVEAPISDLDGLMAVVRLYAKNPTPTAEFKVRCALRDALAYGVPVAQNPCKLTECRGKPRCGTCLAMDAAYPQPPQPVLWQWRRLPGDWTTDYTFPYEVYATTPDSEVRPLYAGPVTRGVQGEVPRD